MKYQNDITQLEVEYLQPSRTIEQLKINCGKYYRICFVYNYDGCYFRFFENREELSLFLSSGKEPHYSFNDEFELDDFLLNYPCLPLYQL